MSHNITSRLWQRLHFSKSLVIALLSVFALGQLSTRAADPEVVLLAPLPTGNGLNFFVGSQVLFVAEATDPDGTEIVSYQFTADGVERPASTSRLFVYTVPRIGEIDVEVTATDEDGESATSTITITARNEGFAPINVNLTSPSNNSSFLIGENFTVDGTFASSGQSLDGLILIENGIFQAEQNPSSNSFSFDVDADIAGEFSYSVIAYFTISVNVGIDPESGATIFRDFTMANLSFPFNDITVTSDPISIVSIVTPSDGDTLTFGRPVSLEASVSSVESDAQVSVDFLVNDELVGSAASAPYSVLWTPDANGPTTIEAVVKEDGVEVNRSQAIAVNVVVNNTLSVEIASPAEFSEFDLGTDPINVTANVSGSGAPVSVNFFANGIPIGSAATFPFSIEWSPSVTGTFILTAQASQTSSGSTRTNTSDGIVVQTFDPQLSRPAVTVATPLNDDTVRTGSVINIFASASSLASDISSVEFRVDGVSIGTDTTYPYSARYVVPDSPQDRIVILAIATDANGELATSSVEVSSEDTDASVSLREPANGTQFSASDTLDVAASVFTDGRQVQRVDFLSNGEVFSSSAFSPFESDFETETPGDFLLTARVTFRDGASFSSEAIATQAISTALATPLNFINQAFLDFTGVLPPGQTLTTIESELSSGLITRTDVIIDLLTTKQGQNGVSIVGAFQTILARFPEVVEYQEALLNVDSTNSDGNNTGNIPISLGDTVTGTLDGSTFDDFDRYEFNNPSQQNITANITSPVFINLTFRDSNGDVIDSSEAGFFTINPSLTSNLNQGTFFLDVDGIGTGTYTLFLAGADSEGTGVSGSLVLGTLINSLFNSDEYIFLFGPIPDLTLTTRAGVENRESMVRELYQSKTGGPPTDFQAEQGGLRIANFNGDVNTFTELLITEANLDNGQPLLVDSPSLRNEWTTSLLILAMFNQQPDNATVDEFKSMSLSAQITAMLNDPRYLDRFEPVESLLFNGPIESGYVESSWFGTVFVANDPWFYRQGLGWLYSVSPTSNAIWFYSPQLEWLYTDSELYPAFYSIQRNSWIYYIEGTANPSWFYDFSMADYFSVDLD